MRLSLNCIGLVLVLFFSCFVHLILFSVLGFHPIAIFLAPFFLVFFCSESCFEFVVV